MSGVMAGTRIAGWGSALPEEVVDNAAIARPLDVDAAWILERTGIRQRRLGGSTAGLAAAACRQALGRARWAPADVDMLILATMSPDSTCPATAPAVQAALGLACGAFDVNAACTGFLYGFVSAVGLLATGLRRVLLVGSETMHRIVDWNDRNTAALFGDGAGALALEAVAGPGDVRGWSLASDGRLAGLIHAPLGGTMRMEGREVFRQAVRLMVESVETTLARAGCRAEDVRLFVPHQANQRILEAAAPRLGIPLERTVSIIEHTGNTSAASIPLALAHAADAGRLAPGDLVLLTGFGAGMTSGSVLVRWSIP